MGLDIGYAFETVSDEVRTFLFTPNTPAPGHLKALFRWLCDGTKPGLLVDINGQIVTSSHGIAALNGADGKMRGFTFLTDNPSYYPSRFARWPRNCLVGTVDRSFSGAAGYLLFNKPRYVFFPHGGPPDRRDTHPLVERDIDFLFIGNVAETHKPKQHADAIFPDEPQRRDLFLRSLEQLDQRRAFLEHTLLVARETPKRFQRKDIPLVANALEAYVNARQRARALALLEGLPVTVVGRISHPTLGSQASFDTLGFVPFDDCQKLLERSKVLVNVRPGFPTGGHERIFYALAHGCGVCTSRSELLEPDRQSHGHLEFHADDLSDLRETVLDLRDRVSSSGANPLAMFDHYEKHHTWSRRLRPVMEALMDPPQN